MADKGSEYQVHATVHVDALKGIHLTAEQKADLKQQCGAAVAAVLNKHAATAGKKISVSSEVDKNDV
jgi:hypothetical protein